MKKGVFILNFDRRYFTGNDQRKRRIKITRRIKQRRPMMYHFDFFQIIFLNVFIGDEIQRNDVTGRLKNILKGKILEKER